MKAVQINKHIWLPYGILEIGQARVVISKQRIEHGDSLVVLSNILYRWLSHMRGLVVLL